MFGSSRIGRSLVRTTLNAHAWVNEHAPAKLRKWVNRRMDNRVPVMLGGGVLAVLLLVRSNNRFRNRKKEMPDETLFQTILTTGRPAEVWPLLRIYINEKQQMFLNFAAECFSDITDGFLHEKPKLLARTEKSLITEKDVLKGQRRKLTLCLRRVAPEVAMEKGAWFHLYNNMAMSMTYNLHRINEACKEHVDNNFRPLPQEFHDTFRSLCEGIRAVVFDSNVAIGENRPDAIDELRRRCDKIKTGWLVIFATSTSSSKRAIRTIWL